MIVLNGGKTAGHERKASPVSRERILKELYALAFAKCNDAVKLAFPDKGGLSEERIAKLDLRCLAGVHTTSGGIELKLADRTKLIELLLAATEEQPDPGAAAGGLIAAINGAADRLGELRDDGGGDPV